MDNRKKNKDKSNEKPSLGKEKSNKLNRQIIRRANPDADSLPLRIISYNILNETSAQPKYYPYCKPSFLHFNYRSKCIINNEIARYDADLVCMQEVDHFKDFYSVEMGKIGYDSAYKQKEKDDGCAIFYKREKFYMSQRIDVEFNDLITKMQSDEFQTDNVGVLVLLETLSDTHQIRIIVGNVHLYWDPKKSHIREQQTQYFLQQLQKLADENSLTLSDTPVLICGDFNSSPLSQVFKIMSNEVKQEIEPSVPLRSVYDQNMLEFTMCIPQAKEVIDFIWHSERVRVASHLEGLSLDVIKKEVGTDLPSEHFPSDHIPLMADLLLH